MSEIEHPSTATLVRDLRAQQGLYKLYASYYDGVHRLLFSTEKFKNAFGDLFRAFADNLCEAVVDALTDRLQVQQFQPLGGAEDQELSQRAWDVWLRNRMDRRSGEVHNEAVTLGDAYVLVWVNELGEPVIWPQRGYACRVEYSEDDPTAITRAIKMWWEPRDKAWYLTIYTPEVIEKYVQPATDEAWPDKLDRFVPREVPGEPWPLPNFLGVVPIVHFGNNARTGGFGRSELHNVIPLQDALNKSVADMLVAAEYTALPQRWATGLEVEIDPVTGKPRNPFTPGPDSVWAVAAQEARFGTFEAGDIEKFLKVQNDFRAEIARVTKTPLHVLMLTADQFPSGEALRTAETPFTKKVRDRQVAFGESWANVMQIALRILDATEPPKLETVWEDASPESESQMLDRLLKKKDLGVSRTFLLREAGYTDEQIAEMKDESDEEAISMADALTRSFNAGMANRPALDARPALEARPALGANEE